ncbi:MAG TPA: peptidylprolyl isomerase [Bryobacteraceae bacterium]|nr:peptidylprolyl isomerase [Bryobacteraceae bacterium]
MFCFRAAVLGLTAAILLIAQSAAPPVHHTTAPAAPPVPLPAEPGTYAVFYTSMGNVVCKLFDKDAPKTVANFIGLASGTKSWTDPTTGKLKRVPLYSGTTFHRVIPDFMIQGGDPTATGMGQPGYKFDNEISPNHSFDKPGILAMANSGPNTNGSQFFITTSPQQRLDGNYSIFGEVVSGQDIVDAISKVPTGEADKPITPVKLIRIAIRKVAAKPGVEPAPPPK